MIIAIDGPAASGKGTIAQRLGAHFGFPVLDTGLLYRAVGHVILSDGGDPTDEKAALAAARAVLSVDPETPALRAEAAGSAASKVAAIPSVRQALLDVQRAFAAAPPGGAAGAILDGRDIGTVICPDADAKLFITAEVETRADRRHKQLLDRGVESIYARVLADLQERDDRDSSRSSAPLVPAKDALIIDTSAMDVEAVFAVALDFVEKQTAKPRGES